jgi:site-specific DNA-methyltransferase (cytosine-N4-specific)
VIYVQDADFTLHQGDARAVLAELDAGTANCIVTSPPYYLLRDYEVDGQIGAEDTLEEYVGALVDVFAAARRVLADDGTLWLNLGDTYASSPRGPRHGKTSTLSTPDRQERVSPVVNKIGRAAGTKPKDLMLVPFEVAFALRADGWWMRQVIVWDKPNPIPESAKDRPTTSHEYVLLLSKSRHYWYDADAIAEPAAWERWGVQTTRKTPVGKAQIARELWPGVGKRHAAKRAAAAAQRLPTPGDQPTMVARETRNARSVWRIVCAHFPGDHAAVMPEELAERCIRAGSRPGDTILDPFAGAGTTALAARAHGRRSIGIELSEKSCAIAAERLSQQSVLAEAAS